jgi:bacterioferritin
MSHLVQILSDIVEAEYAQWMRYTFLAAIQRGPHSDSLQEHLEEHAADELEHAQTISWWIVDLGAYPPTTIPHVEQFDGSLKEQLEWVIGAEIDGINKYQLAHEMADGIYGLQSDIGELLSVEHEHLSDAMKWLEIEDGQQHLEPLIVVIGSAYRRCYEKHASFRDLVNNKFKKTAQKNPANFYQYLNELLELALYKYVYEYTPYKGYLYILEDTQKTIENLWERHKAGEDVKGSIDFFVNLYKWLQSPEVVDKWDAEKDSLHDHLLPDWKQWLQTEVPEKPKQPESGLGEALQESSKWTEEDIEKERLLKREKELERERLLERKRELEEEKQRLQQQQQEEQEEQEEQKKRRPAENAMNKLLAQDPKNKKDFYEMRVGDRIRNMKPTDPDIPEAGKSERTKKTLGEIKEINDDGTFSVLTGDGKMRTWRYPGTFQLDLNNRWPVINTRKPVGKSVEGIRRSIMDKQAVDSTAKDYWTKYFKEYGQMWTRNIPRRIKQAVRRDLQASAIDGDVIPLAKDISDDQILSIEAAFVGKIDEQDARVLVTAAFNQEGKIQDIDITRIS